MSSRHLHVLGDLGGTDIEGAAEQTGEGQHVVDLVREVAATRGHDGHCTGGLLGTDLRIGVGHREHDRVLGHGQDIGAVDEVRATHTDEHIGARHDVAQRTLTGFRVGVLGEPLLGHVEIAATVIDRTFTIDTDDVAHAGVHEDLGDGHTGSADTGDDDGEIFHALVHDLECIVERGEGDHRGAVLIIMEHRNVEQFLETILDLEAGRSRDVLEIDAAEARRNAHNGVDDLLRILGVETDRVGVDAGELLEQQGLALHDRHGAERTDVAQTEHGGAVAHDGHGVLAHGEIVRQQRIGLDGLAHTGHTRGVGHGEVIAITDGDAGQRGDLAALMERERAVLPAQHLDVVEGMDGGEHLLLMRLAGAVDHHVLIEERVGGLEALERPDVAPGAADGGGQMAQRARDVLEPDAETDAECGGGSVSHRAKTVVRSRGCAIVRNRPEPTGSGRIRPDQAPS